MTRSQSATSYTRHLVARLCAALLLALALVALATSAGCTAQRYELGPCQLAVEPVKGAVLPAWTETGHCDLLRGLREAGLPVAGDVEISVRRQCKSWIELAPASADEVPGVP